jgi:O-antigen ligase
MFDTAFLYAVTDFFNIANTFDRGGLSGELTETLLPRITGLSPEPSFWSIYLCTVLSVGLFLGRKLWSLSMLFLTLVMLLTIARTGMVVFVFIVLFQLFRRAPVVIAFLLVALLIGLVVQLNFDYSEADLSIIQRFDSLSDGWNAFLLAPVLGLGWGGFKQYALVNNLDYPIIFNYYLQVAVDSGLLGLVTLLLFLISLVANVQREARIVLGVIFVAWLSAPAYNLAYVWFLFGVLLAAQCRQLLTRRFVKAQQLT